MNKLFIFVLLWFACVSNYTMAQTTPFQRPHYYAGVHVSVPIGVGLTGAYITKSGFGASMGITNLSPTAWNLPKDYNNGEKSIIADKVRDKYNIYSLRIVKEFPYNGLKNRLGLEIGASFVHASKAINFKKVDNSCFPLDCDPYYIYERQTIQTAGLSFKAKVQKLRTPYFNIEFAAQANVNKIRTLFGAEMALNFGKISELSVKK